MSIKEPKQYPLEDPIIEILNNISLDNVPEPQHIFDIVSQKDKYGRIVFKIPPEYHEDAKVPTLPMNFDFTTHYVMNVPQLDRIKDFSMYLTYISDDGDKKERFLNRDISLDSFWPRTNEIFNIYTTNISFQYMIPKIVDEEPEILSEEDKIKEKARRDKLTENERKIEDLKIKFAHMNKRKTTSLIKYKLHELIIHADDKSPHIGKKLAAIKPGELIMYFTHVEAKVVSDNNSSLILIGKQKDSEDNISE